MLVKQRLESEQESLAEADEAIRVAEAELAENDVSNKCELDYLCAHVCVQVCVFILCVCLCVYILIVYVLWYVCMHVWYTCLCRVYLYVVLCLCVYVHVKITLTVIGCMETVINTEGY